MTYRQFTEHIKASIRRVGQTFTEPDDDWLPFLFLDFGGGDLAMVPLPLEAFADAETKDVLSWAISETARVTQPTKIGFVSSTWQVKFDKDDPRLAYRGDDVEPAPSVHPRRFEAVMLVVIDAERVEGHMAVIHRRRHRPPKLGPWESPSPDATGLSGRWVEPLQEAIR